jgi:oligopeptide/dipeptide ABC transporter ATP-binding protein
MSEADLLEVDDLHTNFAVRRGGRAIRVPAVDGVSLSLGKGEVLGIVGESGCGKTTVGRSIMRLARAQGGRVLFRGTDVLRAGGRDLDDLRLNIRMVFQDPYASLNPRRTVGDSIAEAGDINGAFKDRDDRERRVAETLSSVGLDPSFASRYPHELSGGQRQRVGIARAILPVPGVIIADEPVSALDVSVQAQVLNLLMDLRARLELAMIFISHDIGVIGYVSDRVAVMYMGRVVELADAEPLLAMPAHPYTQALMAAVPRVDASVRIKGALPASEPPSQFARPAGCSFAPRCPLATDRCRVEAPELRRWGADHRQVACHNI